MVYPTWLLLWGSFLPDIDFGSEDPTLDPELCSLFEEAANEFLDMWEDPFSLASSWHFLFFRIPIKAVVLEREFLSSSFVSSCLFSDSTSAKENTGISGLASVQTFEIALFFEIPMGDDVK